MMVCTLVRHVKANVWYFLQKGANSWRISIWKYTHRVLKLGRFHGLCHLKDTFLATFLIIRTFSPMQNTGGESSTVVTLSLFLFVFSTLVRHCVNTSQLKSKLCYSGGHELRKWWEKEKVKSTHNWP